MEITSIDFERIITGLLEAEHDVDIDGVYFQEMFPRQFDGIKTIELDSPIAPIKIGFECKNWNANDVGISVIEAYTTKKLRCGHEISQIIVITSSRFTRGAILEAKTAGIQLVEFRECTAEDIERVINDTESISEVEIKVVMKQLPEIKIEVHAKDETASLTNDESSMLIGVRKLTLKEKNDQLFDDDGYFIGSFIELVTKRIGDLIFKSKLGEEKISEDLSDQKLYFKRKIGNRIVSIRLLRYDVTLTSRPDIERTTRIRVDDFDPEDYFIMSNPITGDCEFKRKERVQEIIDAYGLEN
ncbi:MAG: restriction endonuclease [Candidatus Thorarchaeota archaeon]